MKSKIVWTSEERNFTSVIDYALIEDKKRLNADRMRIERLEGGKMQVVMEVDTDDPEITVMREIKGTSGKWYSSVIVTTETLEERMLFDTKRKGFYECIDKDTYRYIRRESNGHSNGDRYSLIGDSISRSYYGSF